MVEQALFVERSLVLTDGLELRLAAQHCGDLQALQRCLRGTSSRTRYLRFHSYLADLTPSMWRELDAVDGYHHISLIAWEGDQVVGVARCFRLDQHPEVGEISVLIADAMQRRGLGTQLLAALTDCAASLGIHTFQAYVLRENLGMRRLMAAPRFTDVSERHGVIQARLAARLAQAPAAA